MESTDRQDVSKDAARIDTLPGLPEPHGIDWSTGEKVRYYTDDQMRAYAAAAVAAAVPQWRPIETAPRDGTLILGTDCRMVAAIWWAPEKEPGYPWAMVAEWMGKTQDNSWKDNEHGPTHWMPLPAAPEVPR